MQKVFCRTDSGFVTFASKQCRSCTKIHREPSISHLRNCRLFLFILFMEDILQSVIEKSGISKEEILGKRRKADVCEARRIFIYLASKSYSGIQIACFLGMSIQNTYYQLKTFKNELQIYRSLREKLKQYE